MGNVRWIGTSNEGIQCENVLSTREGASHAFCSAPIRRSCRFSLSGASEGPLALEQTHTFTLVDANIRDGMALRGLAYIRSCIWVPTYVLVCLRAFMTSETRIRSCLWTSAYARAHGCNIQGGTSLHAHVFFSRLPRLSFACRTHTSYRGRLGRRLWCSCTATPTLFAHALHAVHDGHRRGRRDVRCDGGTNGHGVVSGRRTYGLICDGDGPTYG